MNMLATIAPKSDQLNADDLIGGQTKTITITKVIAGSGDANQPVDIHYEGGLPYRPCKSMRRVLVHIWGPDAKAYVGRSLTLYRDDEVVFGGVKVGGLRISHMSHMESEVTVALTASKAKRKAFRVMPLTKAPTKTSNAMPLQAQELIETYKSCRTQSAFDAAEKVRSELWKSLKDDHKLTLKAESEAAKLRITAEFESGQGELFGDDQTDISALKG